jgi:hypothetical protein
MIDLEFQSHATPPGQVLGAGRFAMLAIAPLRFGTWFGKPTDAIGEMTSAQDGANPSFLRGSTQLIGVARQFSRGCVAEHKLLAIAKPVLPIFSSDAWRPVSSRLTGAPRLPIRFTLRRTAEACRPPPAGTCPSWDTGLPTCSSGSRVSARYVNRSAAVCKMDALLVACSPQGRFLNSRSSREIVCAAGYNQAA